MPAKHREGESETGTRAPFGFRHASGGSAWLMTRFTVGNARRSARSISSTFSCTLITLIEGAARQWKLTISPASVSRTRTLWTSWIALSAAKRDKRGLDGLDAVGRGVGAVRQFRFQRFDVGVDLDVLAELVADVPLQLLGDVVGGRQRHLAVDFEIDADGELAAEIVHGDMVDGETGIAGDHHDAFAHALIVVRDRHGGEGQVGIVERPCDRRLRLSLDLLDAVDRIGARHLHDGVDEVRRADHPHPQAFDVDHAGHRPDRGGGLLRRAFGRAVEQGFHGGARQPQAEQRDHDRDRDGGGGVAPGIAQSGKRQSDNDGDRAEHVGREMQRVGGQRLALGVVRGAMQRPGAPEIHRDIDQQDDKRDRRDASAAAPLRADGSRIPPECRRPARRACAMTPSADMLSSLPWP